MGMYGENCGGNAAGMYSSSVWGIIIFLLILFWVFGNRNNGGWNGNGWATPWGGMGGMPFGAWGLNEHTPKDNDNRLANLQATMEKDTAVLTGQLETAFREVINNQNNNAGRIVEDNLRARNAELERENFRLYVNAQNDQIKAAIGSSNAELNHRLDILQGQMITKPPFYPSGCVPCVTNCCGGDSGCGCNA